MIKTISSEQLFLLSMEIFVLENSRIKIHKRNRIENSWHNTNKVTKISNLDSSISIDKTYVHLCPIFRNSYFILSILKYNI